MRGKQMLAVILVKFYWTLQSNLLYFFVFNASSPELPIKLKKFKQKIDAMNTKQDIKDTFGTQYKSIKIFI